MSLDSFVTLGRSGLHVSPFCLGAMTFGQDHGFGATPEDSTAIFAEYLNRGGNFIDTANLYTNGHSEKIIGDFFKTSEVRRDKVVISTKFYSSMFDGDPNAGGASRKALLQQAEASLRRLQTDYIDVYWLHNWDKITPIEETLRGLEDLVTAGKVRYIGLSDLPAWKISQAQTIALFRGWSPIIAVQLEYSLLERSVEGELIPMAKDLGIGVVPWSPLKNGYLSGKFKRGQTETDSTRGAFFGGLQEAEFAVIDVLLAVAENVQASPAAVALAWVRSRSGVASTVIGARRMDQLIDNLTALDLTLPADQIALLDEASKPTLGFPHQYTALHQLVGYPGTTINGVQTPTSPILALNPTRY